VRVARIKWLSVALGVGISLFCQRQAASGDTIAVRILVVDSADEAASILRQLTNGADFAALARDKSTDATAVDGGFLGRLGALTLRPELRDALRDLRPGQLSSVVKLPSGYAILKVVAEPVAANIDSAHRARQAALGAPGSVQYGVQVDGLQEAWSALAAIPKPDGWDRIRKPFVKSIPARTPPSRIGLIVCWSRAMNTAPRNPRTRRRSTGYRCT